MLRIYNSGFRKKNWNKGENRITEIKRNKRKINRKFYPPLITDNLRILITCEQKYILFNIKDMLY